MSAKSDLSLPYGPSTGFVGERKLRPRPANGRAGETMGIGACKRPLPVLLICRLSLTVQAPQMTWAPRLERHGGTALAWVPSLAQPMVRLWGTTPTARKSTRSNPRTANGPALPFVPGIRNSRDGGCYRLARVAIAGRVDYQLCGFLQCRISRNDAPAGAVGSGRLDGHRARAGQSQGLRQ